ncbi:MAG: hypothetical protein DHS20C17_08640 [Cyclobacteriaceae bacterium]|nr:MAG: hypothetical protein DHS20C17_08640 [Cyclobacteriaceae bacterium]
MLLEKDPLVIAYYQYLKKQAEQILTESLLKRELQGFRLLAVSRKMVERMGILCMVYRIDKESKILDRINQELSAVCAFEDWNNQHFLDVAEMSFAVALAVDWVGAWLPRETVNTAKTSLINKGILPSFNEGGTRMFWINSTNNWNAVCHGGMIAAALVIADIDPELAAKTISRALDKMPGSLEEYGPHGIYPEGPTYWGYGTSYSVIAANSLSTALGNDFGISNSPGFMESATFVLQATAPSGEYFNFADCGEARQGRFAVLMSWFASKTGDDLYLDSEFLAKPENLGRMAGPGLVWLSQFERKKSGSLAREWHGRGRNPIAIFRDGENDFYLAAKGGSASISHGNMDAGSFILELNGVRWSIDPGNQSYYPLNKIGFNLAGRCQECPRWTLLTKHNLGHSTISVNDALFNAAGYAPLVDFQSGDQSAATFDMSDILKGQVASANRKFVKENHHSVLIEDRIVPNDSTKSVTWTMMTLADVQPIDNGAILRQDGKELKLSVIEPEDLNISVISLDPPPLEIDKSIKNLKRIEIRVPAYLLPDEGGDIRIRLSVDENK